MIFSKLVSDYFDGKLVKDLKYSVATNTRKAVAEFGFW